MPPHGARRFGQLTQRKLVHAAHRLEGFVNRHHGVVLIAYCAIWTAALVRWEGVQHIGHFFTYTAAALSIAAALTLWAIKWLRDPVPWQDSTTLLGTPFAGGAGVVDLSPAADEDLQGIAELSEEAFGAWADAPFSARLDVYRRFQRGQPATAFRKLTLAGETVGFSSVLALDERDFRAILFGGQTSWDLTGDHLGVAQPDCFLINSIYVRSMARQKVSARMLLQHIAEVIARYYPAEALPDIVLVASGLTRKGRRLLASCGFRAALADHDGNPWYWLRLKRSAEYGPAAKTIVQSLESMRQALDARTGRR